MCLGVTACNFAGVRGTFEVGLQDWWHVANHSPTHTWRIFSRPPPPPPNTAPEHSPSQYLVTLHRYKNPQDGLRTSTQQYLCVVAAACSHSRLHRRVPAPVSACTGPPSATQQPCTAAPTTVQPPAAPVTVALTRAPPLRLASRRRLCLLQSQHHRGPGSRPLGWRTSVVPIRHRQALWCQRQRPASVLASSQRAVPVPVVHVSG